MYNTDTIKSVKIGKQGENNATQIDFNIKSLVDEYGAGTAQLLHQRSNDNAPYIVKDFTHSGNTATWNVTEDDTAYSGYGRAQLNYYVGEVLAKTVIFTTVCAESLTDETGTPAKVKSDLALIAETVENKLSPDNIVGGENVTIEIDGMNVIINSQGGGTTNYENLTNKPSVNGETLTGNKTSEALKITSATYYTPNSTVVNANTFDNGVYNIGAKFTLTVGNEQIVIKKGAILAIKNTSSQTQGVILGNIDYGIVAFKYVQGFSTVIKNLKDMATETQVNAKQDTLTAGTGISIVNNVISATLGITFEVVQTLPESGDNQTIYLVPNSGTAPNIYDEYIWVNNAWEKIGTTDIDLSGYVTSTALATILADYYTKTQVNTALAQKVNTSAVKQTTGSSTTDVMSQKAVSDAIANKIDKPLFFTNISIAALDWEDNATTPDTGFEDYDYKAEITCQGVTADMYAEIVYYDEQNGSGNYSRTGAIGTNSITVYSKDNSAITIPTIIAGAPVIVSIDGEIADGAVTTPKVADGAITVEKLANGVLSVKNYDYAKLNGVNYIELPYTLSSDYIIEFSFNTTHYFNNMSLIGTSKGTSRILLTMYNNKWYASSGTSVFSFGTYETGEHTVIFRPNDGVYFDGERVGAYNAVNDDTVNLWLGGRSGTYSYNQFFKSLKITSASTGDVIADYVFKKVLILGVGINGLYNSVNDNLVTPPAIEYLTDTIN